MRSEHEASVRSRRTHGYETARRDVAAHVPHSVVNILELGCSTGALGALIKDRQPASVVGVEIDPEYAEVAAQRLDRVIAASAEEFLAEAVPPEAPFDCLVAADVLEHLVDPWSVLARAADMLTPGATVIVSVPNVLYWKALAEVVRGGRWPRKDEGIFDRTHLRWFGLSDVLELFEFAGLSGVSVEPRFWVEGSRLRRARRLYRTRLQPFLAAQYVATGLKTAR